MVVQFWLDRVQNSLCCSCHQYSKGKTKKLAEPAIYFHPSQTAQERIKLTLQMQRRKCAELEQKLEEMKLEIRKSSVGVDHQLSQNITSILGKSDKVTPFTCMDLFWQQQKKLLTSSSTGVQYHPVILRYCLSLAAKSPVCYEELCKKVRSLSFQVSKLSRTIGTVSAQRLDSKLLKS